jgi:hypothetical protein
MLACRLSRTAVANLVLCENSSQEKLAVPLDHLLNPQYFDDVRSDTNNTHFSVLQSQPSHALFAREL